MKVGAAVMSMPENELLVDSKRLIADLEHLGTFGRNAAGGIDRASFSSADIAARKWLIGRCEEDGLCVTVDGIGNMVVSSPTLESGIADQAPVWTGSHIDTVPNGGAFDGALGALAAVECLRRLHEARLPLSRPIRAIVYTDEEGNYAHLLGSTALTRAFTLEELAGFVGRDGDRFADTFVAAGGDLTEATGTRREPGALFATVELHIEQGPLLEQRAAQIGVVTGVVALGGGTMRFSGRADHAGTTPMLGRKDSVVAAAEFISGLPALALGVGPAAVATTGIVRTMPGGSNVIAETVEVVVDFRDPSYERAQALEILIIEAARDVAARHGVRVVWEAEDIVPNAPMNEDVRRVIRQTAEALGYSAMSIPSGAGHDSQNMARLAPTGMIFVPSAGGRSHSPAEHTSWPDVVRGANTLLGTVVRLATRPLGVVDS